MRRIFKNEKTAASVVVGIALMVAISVSAAAAVNSVITHENNKLIEQEKMTDSRLHVINGGNGNLTVLSSDSEIPEEGNIILEINEEKISISASTIYQGATIDIGSYVKTHGILANGEGAYSVNLIVANPYCSLLTGSYEFSAEEISSSNNPPVISNIPNQEITEGETFTTINLDEYVDDEDPDEDIIWTHSGENDLTVDITNRIATITTPYLEWHDSETITFKATDTGGLWDEDPATFTVTAENYPPVISNIPNQEITEGETFTTINLDEYVDDEDPDEDIIWTHSGENDLTVDITNRIATITTPYLEWHDSETITFKATDTGGLWDEDPATFTVTAENYPPVVYDIPDQTIPEGTTFTTINLDEYVDDEDPDKDIIWTHSGENELTVDITNRIATITTPDSDWFGFETIMFRATDTGGLWDKDLAIFTVTNVNDPPYTPSDPIPVNNAENVNINADLSWTGGDPDPGDIVTYDIYFGTDPSPPQVEWDHGDTTYGLEKLNYGMIYYWQVVSRDSYGAETPGPIWSFTVEPGSTPHL